MPLIFGTVGSPAFAQTTQLPVEQLDEKLDTVSEVAAIGGSAPQWSEIDEGKFLPAAGLGMRFRASKTTPINLRVDYAWGRGSQALYIGIGEAF